MKKHIFIVRHAESTANVNTEGLLSKDKAYVNDCSFDITEKGELQAWTTGRKIANIMNLEKYELFVSPYKRTRRTAEELMMGIQGYYMDRGKEVELKYTEDPRLIEQDFGDFDFQYRPIWPYVSPHSFMINQARFYDKTGRFFARLENGENLLDVYNRVSLFVATRLERSKEKCSIIVTHGNTQKIFKMFLLNEQVESFEHMKGPYPNASYLHFVYDSITGEYEYIGLG